MTAAFSPTVDPAPAGSVLVEDIAVAAYLMQNGITVLSSEPGRQHNRWNIWIANPIPENLAAGSTTIRTLLSRFRTSPVARFVSQIDAIKRVAVRGPVSTKAGELPDGRYQVGDVGMAAYMLLCGDDRDGVSTIQLDEVVTQGPAWAIRFQNPVPEHRAAGFTTLRKLRMQYVNTPFADFDGKVRALKKAAYGD